MQPVAFEGYRILPVWRQVTPALAEEVAQMWVAEGVLGLAEARRRTGELVCVVRDGEGRLAGVDTAYVGSFRGADDRWFFLRMFLRPAHRGRPALARKLMALTCELLHETGAGVRGAVIVVENRRLTTAVVGRTLARDGWRHFGRGPAGKDIWYWPFSDATL